MKSSLRKTRYRSPLYYALFYASSSKRKKWDTFCFSCFFHWSSFSVHSVFNLSLNACIHLWWLYSRTWHFYCIDTRFVFFTFNVCYVNTSPCHSGQRNNILHNILHIPLQTILTLLVILFAPDYVINEPFLSLICTDQLKYVRDELIWHGRRKEMH